MGFIGVRWYSRMVIPLCVCVCLYPVLRFEACDWSTRFMRVISLGLSSVNRFCSTDWDTAKCVKVVYKSVHVCYSCLVNQDVKEELDDDHDHENEIDRKFDEARGAKLKYN